MQNTNDVQHIQTTITELRDMTDVIFAVEPIQPLEATRCGRHCENDLDQNMVPRCLRRAPRGVPRRGENRARAGRQSRRRRDCRRRVALQNSRDRRGGAPVLDANGNPRMIMGTQFTKPPVLTIERHVADGYKYGILLLDELMQAGQDVQKVLSDVLDPDERTIAGHPLPEGWIVAFTGNRARDKSGATRLLSMLTNRALVGELNFDVTQWSQWAIGAGVNQAAIDAAVQHTDADTGLGFFHDSVPSQTDHSARRAH